MEIFTIPGRGYDSNVYVILGRIPTVVDTGTGFHSGEIIHDINRFVDIESVQLIVLTHEHYDHVGGTLDILSASKKKARVLASVAALDKFKVGKSDFAEMLGGKMPHISVTDSVKGGEQILVGDEEFQVFATPGHSLGSICLFSPVSGSLFSGDTIFAHGDFGRYDFPGGDFQSLVQSIKRLSSLKIINLYPGHGPIVEGSGVDHVRKSLYSIQTLM